MEPKQGALNLPPLVCTRCHGVAPSIALTAVAVDGREMNLYLHDSCIRAMARELGDRAPELAGVVQMLDEDEREESDVRNRRR